jgi:hypothetical protein
MRIARKLSPPRGVEISRYRRVPVRLGGYRCGLFDEIVVDLWCRWCKGEGRYALGR